MFPIATIFEDEDLLMVNKPAEISLHNDESLLGLHSLLTQQHQSDLWPVHRLDKLTSGLLIFAKNKPAAVNLGDLFEQHAIHKTYIAISDKKPKKKQGLVKGDMLKTRSGSWRLDYSQNNPAITTFKSVSIAPNRRLFVIHPQTGKTHQIRVALKSLGSPIVGDPRYGGSKSDRGYLHAYRLAFEWKNKPMKFRCLPDSGEHFLLIDNLTSIIDNLSNR